MKNFCILRRLEYFAFEKHVQIELRIYKYDIEHES